MGIQTFIGIKDKYLMLILEIVLLESSEVETEPPKDRRTENRTDRRTENRTDRRKFFIKYRYLVRYLSNKKRIFKIDC